MEMSSQLNVPAALSLVKQPRCLLDRRMGGPRAGLEDVEEKNISSPAAN